MKEFKVLEENVLKAYEAQDDKGKQLLVDLFPGKIIPIPIRLRIDNGETLAFEDFLADQGITVEAFEKSIENNTEDEASWKRAKIISKAINITPLKDGETWYVPLFYKSGSGFSYSYADNWYTMSDSRVGARLYGFREKSMSDWAGKNLPHIYKPLI